MSIRAIWVLTVLLFSCGKDDGFRIPKEETETRERDYWYSAADLSFYPQITADNFVFKNAAGEEVELMQFLKDKGINLVRARLWHSPEDEHSSLTEALALAQEVKIAGMNFYLDFHYSDTWADPGNQAIPSAWADLSFEELETALYDYTKDVLEQFESQGTLPVMVQLGNETNTGFLESKGRMEGDNTNFKRLMGKALEAVRDVSPEIQTMIHYAGNSGATNYFTSLTDLDFDVIGISYYSRWHTQSLSVLSSELNALARLNKNVFIAETAYPFTHGWNDWTNNIWGLDEHLIDGYPASAAGQANYLRDLNAIISTLYQNRGVGISYWAPDWVASKGEMASDGSPWENMCLFDFDGKALVGLDELGFRPE